MVCRDPEYLTELRSTLRFCIENEPGTDILRQTLLEHIQDLQTLFDEQSINSSDRKIVESGTLALQSLR